jgi:uncharacterized UPF0160 family protein
MNWLKSKKLTVAVHDGHFHADDVFAVAIFSLYIKKPIEIIRTRDLSIIEKADYAFDVGRKYDPGLNQFDHHLDGIQARDNGVPYAACGLVWKHFGESLSGSKEAMEIIDSKIIQVVDATDNGLDTHKRIVDSLEPYLFVDYVFSLNPTWKEKGQSESDCFKQAVEIVKAMLVREIKRTQDYLESKKKMIDIYRQTVDKRIVVFEEEYSWKTLMSEYSEPLFVIRPVVESKVWYVSAVKVKGEKFLNRLNFPVNWGGKDGEEIVRLTGVSDAVFCHKNLFMCSARTKEGAIKLAELAINNK